MKRGLLCCRLQSRQQSIPQSRELDRHQFRRCRMLQKNLCHRWWREPGGRLAPRCFHICSQRLGRKSLSPLLCISPSLLPLVPACSRASPPRNSLELVELCTPVLTLARKHLSLAFGSLVPRSQKPPCSPLRLGFPGKSFDPEGRTGTRCWFRKSGPQHCCTAALAHPCTPLSQQENTVRGSPGEKCLQVPGHQLLRQGH